MRIEIIPLIVNIICFSYYLVQWREFGKMCYWFGAVLLTVGLLKMRG